MNYCFLAYLQESWLELIGGESKNKVKTSLRSFIESPEVRRIQNFWFPLSRLARALVSLHEKRLYKTCLISVNQKWYHTFVSQATFIPWERTGWLLWRVWFILLADEENNRIRHISCKSIFCVVIGGEGSLTRWEKCCNIFLSYFKL